MSRKIAVTRVGEKTNDGGKRKRAGAHFPFATTNEFWGQIVGANEPRNYRKGSRIFTSRFPLYDFHLVPFFSSISFFVQRFSCRLTCYVSSSATASSRISISPPIFEQTNFWFYRGGETVDRAEGTGDCHANEFEVLPFYISTCLRPRDNPTRLVLSDFPLSYLSFASVVACSPIDPRHHLLSIKRSPFTLTFRCTRRLRLVSTRVSLTPSLVSRSLSFYQMPSVCSPPTRTSSSYPFLFRAPLCSPFLSLHELSRSFLVARFPLYTGTPPDHFPSPSAQTSGCTLASRRAAECPRSMHLAAFASSATERNRPRRQIERNRKSQ